MIKKTAVIMVLSVFLTNGGIFSQPAATVQLTGGFSIPLPDLRGDFGKTITQFTGNGNPDSNTYFMKSGSNYGLAFKVPINRKKFPLNIIGSMVINQFSNSTEYNIADTNFITSDLSQTITTLGLGLEYIRATRRSIINPYAGFKITFNLFSGQYVETDNYLGTTSTFNLIKTVRVGVEANIGVDWVLHNNVGVTLAAKYSFANLIGKSSGKDTPTKYYLNDAERTDNGVKYPERKITYVQIFGGISFYFGR